MKYLEFLAWLLLLLVVAGLTRAGVQHRVNVRAELQAQEKRAEVYQQAWQAYTQVPKPGINRKEIEDYLHLNKIEFQREPIDDLRTIASEGPPWYCGTPDVYWKFHFNHADRKKPQEDIDDKDTLSEIKIAHFSDRCL
jgi:hypothetical protein